ncbi:MAG TPA: alpha/beta hydrolase-fold protein, partial [Alphaproteobacteria bacterium]|nr:alpha/beta hydrolase-fold protein [Alphaproteobacteria bacterium]
MKSGRYWLYSFLALAVFAAMFPACASATSTPRFVVTLPASQPQTLTGRVFVIIARSDEPEPRLQVGSWNSHAELLGSDVAGLEPGKAAVLDVLTLGYPLKSARELPAGDYYVQALFNVYTKFQRADGNTIWGHNMDQWEGQKFNTAPGNLYSEVRRFHLDPLSGYEIRLSLTQKVPPTRVPANTKYVQHFRIESKLLTQFWETPVYLGATVLLPEGYAEHPSAHYPVIYEQGHFNLRPPLGFSEEPTTTPPREGRISGEEMFKRWTAPGFPRVIAVTFQHPTMYFDDSYAVNSANNGPFGDAVMTELIPYIEEHYRVIRQPYARVLTGGSTGGWESLALQVFHPEFFGGTWTFYPDPVDFSRYQIVDIYNDNNAFHAPGYDAPVPERPMRRTAEGQVEISMRQLSQLEDVLGSHGRSGQQLEAWEAVYGPVGADGYPKPLWDKETGRIDPAVAAYMRDHDYDLRYYMEKNWATIGPQLFGKLHIYCGDMDYFYLNLAVYRLEGFLRRASPAYGGSFEYGRPMKGHGWTPLNQAELVQVMA